MRTPILLIAAACGLLFSTAGQAAKPAPSGGMAVAFGNTIKATYPDGRFQRYWLQADGTWRAIGRRGTASSGKWTQKGETLCLKQTKPFAGPFRYCTSFPSKTQVGASWPAKDAGGGKITLSLVKGHG